MGKVSNVKYPCEVCGGTKIYPHAHPSHRAPCGACHGTGWSTNPWHQPRNATMVTKTSAELDALRDKGIAVHETWPVGTSIWQHDEPRFIALISWVNPLY